MPLADGQHFDAGPAGPHWRFGLRVYLTHGHTDDSVSFLLYPEPMQGVASPPSPPPFRSSLFCGDLMLGNAKSVVVHRTRAYMASLKRVRELCEQARAGEDAKDGALAPVLAARPAGCVPVTVIYGGHGPAITEALKTVEAYIHHREEREARIVGLLRNSPNGHTVDELVTATYPAHLRHEPFLLLGARQNTLATLAELIANGLVRQDPPPIETALPGLPLAGDQPVNAQKTTGTCPSFSDATAVVLSRPSYAHEDLSTNLAGSNEINPLTGRLCRVEAAELATAGGPPMWAIARVHEQFGCVGEKDDELLGLMVSAIAPFESSRFVWVSSVEGKTDGARR